MTDPYNVARGPTEKKTMRKVAPDQLDEQGRRIVEGPVSAPGAPRMSKATIDGARRLAAEMEKQEALRQQQVEEIEEPAPPDPPAPSEQEEEKTPTRTHPSIAEIQDNFFYQNTVLDNIHTRRKIEARSPELDLDDVLYSDHVTQKVSIIPGKMEVVFRSMRKSDGDWIDTQAMTQFDSQVERVNFIQNARLVIQVVSVKGKRNIRMASSVCRADKQHIIDKDAFYAKMGVITGLKETVITLLTVNMGWFNDRLNNAPLGDLLKNI
jgi:hypothetical protein